MLPRGGGGRPPGAPPGAGGKGGGKGRPLPPGGAVGVSVLERKNRNRMIEGEDVRMGMPGGAPLGPPGGGMPNGGGGS